jgi:hypothetical protein
VSPDIADGPSWELSGIGPLAKSISAIGFRLDEAISDSGTCQRPQYATPWRTFVERRGLLPNTRTLIEMVSITERATMELQRLRYEHLARPRQGVRLSVDAIDRLSMSIDSAHLGDSVFRRDNTPLLIVDGRLSPRLANRVLDFLTEPEAGSKRGFKLGWRDPEPAVEP